MGIMSERDLAESLGVSPWTVRNWRLNAGLPYFGTAGRIFYRKEAVEEWIKREEQKNSQRTNSKVEQSMPTNQSAVMS